MIGKESALLAATQRIVKYPEVTAFNDRSRGMIPVTYCKHRLTPCIRILILQVGVRARVHVLLQYHVINLSPEMHSANKLLNEKKDVKPHGSVQNPPTQAHFIDVLLVDGDLLDGISTSYYIPCPQP